MRSNAQPDNAGPDGDNDKKTKFCSCCPLRFGNRFKSENKGESEREKLLNDTEDARKPPYGSTDTGHSVNNPSMKQPRPSQPLENEKKVEEIKMETLGLTKVDEIFSRFQSTFNAFYFCQVDMQTAVKDFKTAVNTTGEFRVCLREFTLQLSGHRVVIKKLAIKFPKTIEKGGGSIADGAKALVSILKMYEEMENLPVKVTRKGVECLKDVMELDVSELTGEEVGGNVFDLASKIPKQVKSMRKNMKEIAKAPKIVSEFFKYATSIVMEVIEAFGDPKNKEYLTKKNDKVENNVDKAKQELEALVNPEPPKEIKFTSLGVPTVDRIFNDVAKLVNPVIRLSRDCFDARKSLEKAIKGISEFCDDPFKGFDDYLEELKIRVKKGRVHIKISVNGNRIEIEKVEGLEPRQMQDTESGLKGVIKSGEELFDLAPDSIKKIIALTQDVSKLSKSDIVNHVSLKEVPSKVSTLSENSKKAKKIPGDLKFFLSFMRNLIVDIMLVLNTKKEGGDQSSEKVYASGKLLEDVMKKNITSACGGVIKINDITLTIGAKFLAQDTEITLKYCQDFCFKSLLDLCLIDAAPRVYEIYPSGLKFLKPANLAFRFTNDTSNCEPFILHGFLKPDVDNQRIVWELVIEGVKANITTGLVTFEISGFSFYTYIIARRGALARILSHLNSFFTCRAYVFYRRLPSMETIDLSVVLVSEFVDEKREEEVEQLKYHSDEGYIKGEKGKLKPVNTGRSLEICLDFPGVESTRYSFTVNLAQLDSVGFVFDRFESIQNPAIGSVKIYESNSGENQLLWKLNVYEQVKERLPKPPSPLPESSADPLPEVVYQTTKLTEKEINRMSRAISIDWDSLAALMDIPYSDRDEIKFDYSKYPTSTSKAREIFTRFNSDKFYNRRVLQKHFEELGRPDLKKEMLDFVEYENADVETPSSQPEMPELQLRNTPLSPREMYRLSRCIVVDWECLAALIGIDKAEREDIRYNIRYHDARSRAEKILAIFNYMEGFSRETLTQHLKEILKFELIKPVTTGEWRKLA